MKNTKPVYLIAGSDAIKPAKMIQLIKSILAQTGKLHPEVAYIGTASNDDASFFKVTADMISKAGAHSVTQVILSSDTADIIKAKSFLNIADAVFISGGDVAEGMRRLNHHKFVPFLKNLYQKGIVFFGLSAGSIMLGSQWVHWEDPGDDDSAKLFDCMGIVPVVCDTHGEEDDWKELKTAITLMKKNSLGYGIQSGGTLVVQPDGTLTALDKPVVVYVNTGSGVSNDTIISCG